MTFKLKILYNTSFENGLTSVENGEDTGYVHVATSLLLTRRDRIEVILPFTKLLYQLLSSGIWKTLL